MNSGGSEDLAGSGLDMSRVCFTDRHEFDVTKDEARAVVEAESRFWNLEVSPLQQSLEDMASRLGEELERGRENAAARDHGAAIEDNNVAGDERCTWEETFPSLIPGLPVDLAENCLARVPWICQPKLMTVCKTWAAYLMSNNIFAVRSQQRISERLLVVLSVPVRLGPLRLTVFDAKLAPKLEWDKPLAVFDFLGKWSGFLRGFRCAVIGPDLFIIGGRHDGLQYATGKSVWRFNFITRKWTEAAPMHFARRDFACAFIDGKVYVAGGTDSSRVLPQGHGTISALNSAEMYDSEHDQWHKLPRLKQARVGCLGVALKNRFFVIGGGTDNGTVNFELFRSAEVFDTGKRQWATIEDMWQSEVMLPRAVAGFDHSLFAVDSDDQTLKTYDESANRWNDVMPIPFSSIVLPGRSGHAERQQAMGGLPGDQLIGLSGSPREGLFWLGPTSYLSRAHHLLELRLRNGGSVRRGWSGNVALDVDGEAPSTSSSAAAVTCNEQAGANITRELKAKGRSSCLIIGSGIVNI